MGHWIAPFSECLLAARFWKAVIFLVARDAIAGAVYEHSIVCLDTAQTNYVSSGQLTGCAELIGRAIKTSPIGVLIEPRHTNTLAVGWSPYSISYCTALDTN